MEPRFAGCERISVAGIDGGEHDPFAIGKRIREKRIERGMTGADLGRAIGAKDHTIWRYETQGMTPSAPRMRRIAEVLRVSEQYLMTGATEDSSIENDESVRTALQELLGDWDEELHGVRPDAEEIDWLGTKLDFRTDRRAGLEITPRLLLDRLRERRRQARGKSVARPTLEPPPKRPGTRKLSDADKSRKKKR